MNGLFGPAILITLGMLFLLSSLDVVDFSRSSPFILIVIGGVLLVKHHASTEGHLMGNASVAPPPPPIASDGSNSGNTFFQGR